MPQLVPVWITPSGLATADPAQESPFCPLPVAGVVPTVAAIDARPEAGDIAIARRVRAQEKDPPK